MAAKQTNLTRSHRSIAELTTSSLRIFINILIFVNDSRDQRSLEISSEQRSTSDNASFLGKPFLGTHADQ
jgi:hypothetical protein